MESVFPQQILDNSKRNHELKCCVTSRYPYVLLFVDLLICFVVVRLDAFVWSTPENYY